MRWIAVIAATCLVSLPAHAQESDDFTVPVPDLMRYARSATPEPWDATGLEACIRDNAAQVEQAMDSLEDGTVFLTARLCAGEIADAIRERQRLEREEQAERYRSACEENGSPGFFAQLSGAYDPCLLADSLAPYVVSSYPNGDVTSLVPPAITEFAAELLLQARLARLDAEGARDER